MVIPVSGKRRVIAQLLTESMYSAPHYYLKTAASADGLVTPIVRGRWRGGVIAIDQELRVLIDKALKNALRSEEYTGATFTITNLGSYDITESPPSSILRVALPSPAITG